MSEVDVLGSGSLEATPSVVLVGRIQPAATADHAQFSLHCARAQNEQSGTKQNKKASHTETPFLFLLSNYFQESKQLLRHWLWDKRYYFLEEGQILNPTIYFFREREAIDVGMHM